MHDRRSFLMLCAAGTAGACSRSGDTSAPRSSSTGSSKPVDVTLAAGETDIHPGGLDWPTWAYDGRVPAKEIRLRRGETLRATVTNNLPADTTVHWHGLAIPNPMDGVPVLTQQPIATGQRFTYEFVVSDSGTYWFHSHVGMQGDRGLYGALIIEDPSERGDYDDELVLVLDDWLDGTGTTPDKQLEHLKQYGMQDMGPMGA